MMACKDYYSYNGVIIYISDSEISENKDFGFLFTNCHDHFLQKPINFDVIINNTKFSLIELSETLSDNTSLTCVEYLYNLKVQFFSLNLKLIL